MRQFWPSSMVLFWTWWTGELKALFIRKSAARAPGYKSCTELHLAGDALEVSEITRGKAGIARMPLRRLSIGQGPDLARLLGRRNRPVVLTLPVEKCFLHTLEVPRAALSHIDQLLGLELTRVTPFLAADVLTGWHETGEAPSETYVTIAQVIAKRSLLAPVLADLGRAKVPVAAIYARSAAGDYVPARLSNALLAIGDQTAAPWRKLAYAACLFAVLCAGAAAWNLFSAQSAALADLSERTEIAQKKALAVRKRLAQVESSSQRIVDLKTLKLQGPSPLAVWEELTRLTPDTAFVSAFAIEKTQVTIEGNARSPEELIPALDGSPLFEAVSFAAPVTKLPGNDMTRFVIRLSLSRDLKLSSAAP